MSAQEKFDIDSEVTALSGQINQGNDFCLLTERIAVLETQGIERTKIMNLFASLINEYAEAHDTTKIIHALQAFPTAEHESFPLVAASWALLRCGARSEAISLLANNTPPESYEGVSMLRKRLKVLLAVGKKNEALDVFKRARTVGKDYFFGFAVGDVYDLIQHGFPESAGILWSELERNHANQKELRDAKRKIWKKFGEGAFTNPLLNGEKTNEENRVTPAAASTTRIAGPIRLATERASIDEDGIVTHYEGLFHQFRAGTVQGENVKSQAMQKAHDLSDKSAERLWRLIRKYFPQSRKAYERFLLLRRRQKGAPSKGNAKNVKPLSTNGQSDNADNSFQSADHDGLKPFLPNENTRRLQSFHISALRRFMELAAHHGGTIRHEFEELLDVLCERHLETMGDIVQNLRDDLADRLEARLHNSENGKKPIGRHVRSNVVSVLPNRTHDL